MLTVEEWETAMESTVQEHLLDMDVMSVKFRSGHVIDAYIATSIEEKYEGLSSVEFLDVDGMLFYFSQPSYVPFTMAAMKMDLDISFFDVTGRLIQSGTYKAGDAAPVTCPKPYRYVLESPAGSYGGADLQVV